MLTACDINDYYGLNGRARCALGCTVMILRVNGEPLELPASCHLDDLIARLDLAGRRLAVEVNGEIVPRSEYATRQLAAGDRVEIVQAIGGG
jgi:sulfur carrier protein